MPPECEKLAACHLKSQAIGEFLDWLRSGEADDSGFDRPVFLASFADGEHVSSIHIFYYDVETLLAKFFDIDLKKVEEERRAMLEALRETVSNSK